MTDTRWNPLLREIETNAVKLGTADQKARWHAGVLPEDELLALARGELFKLFDVKDVPKGGGILRWQMLKPDDVRHERDCRAVKAVEFTVTSQVRLRRNEWFALNRITAIAAMASDHAWLKGQPGFTVTTRCHLARCAACHAEIDGISALVSVSWAGRTLSREYAL
jgi:hypothetical protein